MEDNTPHIATIADVARLAGVSIATVSRVVNGSTPVIPETAERVHAAVRQLCYVPRAAARVLASRKTRTIGLIVPEIGGDFFTPLLRGIENAIREMDYSLLIQTSIIDQNGLRQATLGEHNTDGLLVFTNSLPDQELRRLRRSRFPVVLLHREAPEGLEIPTITVENKNGALLAVEHLIQAHRRNRIVFLRGPEDSEDSNWRERGYRQALDAAGIPFDPELVTRGNYSRDGAYQAIQELIRQGVVFDAVFSGDDDSATGVMTALRETGRKVPTQVAIIGFDDVSFSTHLTPPLSTIHAPIEQVGREAVEQLGQIIRGEVEAERKVTLLPTQLVIRQSCGCRMESHVSTLKYRDSSRLKSGQALINLIPNNPHGR
jgi:DNA-binding LacI/PurR family transcriptional regulator